MVCDLSDDCGFLDCVVMGYWELVNIFLVCVLFDIIFVVSCNGIGNGLWVWFEFFNCFYGFYNVSLE